MKKIANIVKNLNFFKKKMRFFHFLICIFSKKVYLNGIRNEQHASVAQLVEHHVANVIVAGSIPVTRSIFFASSTVCDRSS